MHNCIHFPPRLGPMSLRRAARALLVIRVMSAVTLFPATARAQAPSDSAILAIITQRVETKQSAGMVVGLLDHGRPRVVAYGITRPGGPPLDGNSVFEIGSVTKVFTTTVLADMVLKGEVKLDDPVAKYLPSSVHVPMRGDTQITLLDLATQSSGLPRLPSNFAPKDPTNPYA